ncbi:MAG: hypothetical protein ACJA1A_000936 [Saprospiraceae bacterium]|jgi:hypothetical protein|tara:strand:- start:150 stop:581 length:432 start_codon:yes stop_codon:yes gene_type:complete
MAINQVKLPVTYWIVSAIALLWNLVGVANFVFQVFFTDTMVALMSPEHKEMILSNPTWMKLVFGIATIGGLIGAVGLIMRKKWAVPALLVSLIAVIIQMGYSSFATKALEVMDQSPVFPAMIVLFSAVLWFYAKRSDSRGYLN